MEEPVSIEPESLAQQSPKASSNRMVGFDLARCLAIFGMVFVNFKTSMGAEAVTQWGEFWAGLCDGRAAALFVILAGCGISLMSSSASRLSDQQERKAAFGKIRTQLGKRALFLFGLGFCFSWVWSPDILHFYGLYLGLAALFLATSDRVLLGTIVPILCTAVLFLLLGDFDREWNWDTLEYSGLWTPQGLIKHLFFNGFYPAFPWFAFILYGMWLGRQLLTKRYSKKLLALVGMGVMLMVELSSSWMVGLALEENWLPEEEAVALLGTEPLPAMPQYILAAIGSSTVIICCCLWLGEQFGKAKLLKPFIYTGQMALTLYIAHVVLGMGTLIEMGRFEDEPVEWAVAMSCLFSGLALVCCTLWRRKFSRGPLELFMRRVTG